MAKPAATEEPINKEAILKRALENIQKTYGTGAIWSGADEIPKQESVSTGVLTLDRALGIGGLPRGRITEIYGPESTGKTTLALHVAVNVQKAGGQVGFIDVEHAIDLEYAQDLGIDLSRFHVSQPDSGEQAFEIAEALVRGQCDCVIIDSVAMLIPEAEIQGGMSQMQMGAQPRLIGKALRKLMAPIHNANCVFILINQIRMTMSPYGNPETTSGGKAIRYMSSIRLDLRNKGQYPDSPAIPVGINVLARVVKNKVAPPSKEAKFVILYGKGIDMIGNLLDAAVDADIVEKNVGWYRYKGEVLGNGREKTIDKLNADAKLLQELKTKLEAAA